MERKGYKKLIVWEKADELAKKVYKESKKFPKEELFGVTSQLRRAALSVPTNIVEGYARRTKKELKQFLGVALGSLSETEYLLEFSESMGLLSKEGYSDLEDARQQTGNLLWKFYQTV